MRQLTSILVFTGMKNDCLFFNSPAFGACQRIGPKGAWGPPCTVLRYLGTGTVPDVDLAQLHNELRKYKYDATRQAALGAPLVCAFHRNVRVCVACGIPARPFAPSHRKLTINLAKALDLPLQLAQAKWAFGVPITICGTCRKRTYQAPTPPKECWECPMDNRCAWAHMLLKGDMLTKHRMQGQLNSKERQVACLPPRSQVCNGCIAKIRKQVKADDLRSQAATAGATLTSSKPVPAPTREEAVERAAVAAIDFEGCCAETEQQAPHAREHPVDA